MNIQKKLFDHEYKELKRFNAIADKVMALDLNTLMLDHMDLRTPEEIEAMGKRLEYVQKTQEVL